ncbi:hypothetical protein [Methylobacterium organophilum]|uniref:Uncharacterized protein n=1 Tax=Methylobacterium organophilum TaxID=410 RepID=A0ABQ4T787_METOR|nr:hypothetical protein [Methylobacterium organophilum]GJE27540.1 hypothetical protein LKMONMHP_2400 [Methylobacterium organophilum]
MTKPGGRPKLSYEGEYGFAQSWQVIREWSRDDTYPWMKLKALEYLLPRAAFWVSIAVLGSHWYWAEASRCGVNFQRGGAVITVAAALAYATLEWHDPGTAHLSGARAPVWSFFKPAFVLPVLAALGTAVWGYGDLLPTLQTIGCSGS